MDPIEMIRSLNLAKCPELATHQLECDALKGFLHYKMRTSQNVSSEVQVKNFLFCIKVNFLSQDIQVFLFLTIL